MATDHRQKRTQQQLGDIRVQSIRGAQPVDPSRATPPPRLVQVVAAPAGGEVTVQRVDSNMVGQGEQFTVLSLPEDG